MTEKYPRQLPLTHAAVTNVPEEPSPSPPTPNDERKKRPQAHTRLGPTQLRRLLRPGNRMAEPPGYVIDVSAGPREYNADHGLVLGVGERVGVPEKAHGKAPPFPMDGLSFRSWSLPSDNQAWQHKSG